MPSRRDAAGLGSSDRLIAKRFRLSLPSSAMWPVLSLRQREELLHMTFKVGETVVYPHHGAALIEAIEERMLQGVLKTYLRLKVAQGDLTVLVPAENADVVGVRDVVGN